MLLLVKLVTLEGDSLGQHEGVLESGLGPPLDP